MKDCKTYRNEAKTLAEKRSAKVYAKQERRNKRFRAKCLRVMRRRLRRLKIDPDSVEIKVFHSTYPQHSGVSEVARTEFCGVTLNLKHTCDSYGYVAHEFWLVANYGYSAIRSQADLATYFEAMTR